MYRTLTILSIFFLLLSCKEDEGSQDENPNSVAVGDKIYTIEDGFDQEGARGQYLANSFKISVTDFEGKPQYAQISFELSDEGGRVTEVYDSEPGEEDWIVFRWKLGCQDETQTLTIKDNVCNISKDGCVDVTIFEITINTSEPTAGWVEACYEFDFGYSSIEKIFTHEDELFVYTYSDLFVTDDITTNSWNEINTSTQLDEYNDVWHFENGEMIFNSGSSLYLSENNGRNWSNIYVPSYGDGQITILANGKYLYISEYSQSVYESPDKGNTWNVLISDLASLTGESYTGVLAITSSANIGYVITKNHYIIEINLSSNNVHTFSSDAWNGYANVDEAYAMVEGNHLILVTNDYSNYEASVLNLNTDSQTSSFGLASSGTLIKDSGKIYLLPEYNQDHYYEYDGGNFEFKPLDLEESGSYYYGRLTIFNGKPVYYSSSSNKFYYYND
ncbi:hypothetical protein SAMN04488029_2151 [Reichenbachiella faecimaris]|uniref:BNR/Asp-box repeat-containing protein n=2 Tax=Reichenbachiella faecimaris TaxID=692418 RepID=A0A1W2GDW9_REIFA|nr:hypothetical protein SAMN04488029_2151 [Reichenbachiella faecimaris]